MLQQMDLLFAHSQPCIVWLDTIYFYDLFAMDASIDGLVVAHGPCYCFMICSLWMPQQMDLLLHTDTVVMLYVPDLLWRQQSNLLMNCVIYIYDFSDARRKIPGMSTNF